MTRYNGVGIHSLGYDLYGLSKNDVAVVEEGSASG